MNLRQFEWGNPGATYYLFLVLLIGALLYLLHLHRQRFFKRFSFGMRRRSRLYTTLRGGLLCAAWIFAVLALMEPRGNPRYPGSESDAADVIEETLLEEGDELVAVVNRRVAHDVIFLVDASASMEIADMRTGASRLDYAKELADEVVSRLDGQAVALYAFTAEPTAVVPATVDYLYFRLQLRDVRINEGDVAGTDLLEALSAVRERHLTKHKQKVKTLILLTDGGDTRLEALPADKRPQELSAIVGRVADGELNKYRVFAVGLGTQQGAVVPGVSFQGQPVKSTLDEELLRELARTGGGRYYQANDYSVLALADRIVQGIKLDDGFVEEERELPVGRVERIVEASQPEVIYDHYFQWPLGIALIALLGALLLPETRNGGQSR